MVDRVDGKLRKAELARLLAEKFGDMRVIGFPPLIASLRLWKTVKSRILDDPNEIQVKRFEAQVAFSRTHFKAFFNLASDYFCSDIYYKPI